MSSIGEARDIKTALIKQMDALVEMEDMWEVGVIDGLRQGVVECDRILEEPSPEPENAPPLNPKAILHSDITAELNAIYIAKNSDYGDSFGETYKKLGIISAVTRITDKVNRLQSLATNSESERLVKDESIRDTLMDLSNYAIMSLIEMGYDPKQQEDDTL